MNVIFVFLFGLAIGSFLNSVIYRLEQGGSIVRERSRCPQCRHTLSWYELVPLLSFVVQRGRCRACRGHISWQYPLVEIACAILFMLAFWHLPSFYWRGELWFLWYALASLAVIFVVDLKQYIIPNRVLYPLIAVTAVWGWLGERYLPGVYLWWSALGVSGFFLMLFVVSRGTWIGFGDVKFGVFMGLFLGFPLVLVAFFLSYVTGALVSVALLLQKRASLKSQIPFGPFLIMGTLIAYFWGNEIIQWYLNIM